MYTLDDNAPLTNPRDVIARANHHDDDIILLRCARARASLNLVIHYLAYYQLVCPDEPKRNAS